jgi:hypothetical protein
VSVLREVVERGWREELAQRHRLGNADLERRRHGHTERHVELVASAHSEGEEGEERILGCALGVLDVGTEQDAAMRCIGECVLGWRRSLALLQSPTAGGTALTARRAVQPALHEPQAGRFVVRVGRSAPVRAPRGDEGVHEGRDIVNTVDALELVLEQREAFSGALAVALARTLPAP